MKPAAFVNGVPLRILEEFLPSVSLKIFRLRYSSGPNKSGVLNKHGGWTISQKLINVCSGISVWLDFFFKSKCQEFCSQTKDYYTLNDKK